MKSRLIIALVVSLLCGIIFAIYLHLTQEPLLMYREQQQIFLWDSDYIAGLLGQVGGFATLVSQFLVQYFLTPWTGALITGVVIMLTSLFSWLTLQRISESVACLPLAWLPAFLQGVYLLEMGYHYEGLVALLLTSICLFVYTLIAERALWIMRTSIGCILSVMLYLYVGSIAILFTICALINDVMRHHSRSYLTITYLLLCLILAAWFVSTGNIVDYDYALWIKGYCEYHISPGLWLSLSWLLLPFSMMVAWLINRYTLKPYLQAGICMALLLASALFVYVQTEKRINKDFRTLAELMVSINHEDWNGIISNSHINMSNYLHLNCLNLALSHQGRLMTDLFRYPQKGVQSLMVSYQAYNDINVLFTHIYYHLGIVSEALCLSFGTMIATTHGNPSLLKMLIKERLIYGDYQVAEKYITRLEKTPSYQEWATDMRRFLHNDEAVENDPELGMKRRDLPDMIPEFVVVDGIMNDLIKVISTNPENTYALEYAFAMLMLDKNMQGVRYLTDRFLQDWQGKPLPELIQQAVTVLAEHDVDYCRSHGVNEDTIQRFQSFRQTALEARRSNMNQQAALASYRGTFWYYYMFA